MVGFEFRNPDQGDQFDESIYLCTIATDMRKSFDGLSGLVRSEFQREPNDGSLFLFINRRRDRSDLGKCGNALVREHPKKTVGVALTLSLASRMDHDDRGDAVLCWAAELRATQSKPNCPVQHR